MLTLYRVSPIILNEQTAADESFVRDYEPEADELDSTFRVATDVPGSPGSPCGRSWIFTRATLLPSISITVNRKLPKSKLSPPFGIKPS